MCFLGGGTHVTRHMCFLRGGTHITRDICFPAGGTDITREMCFLGRGTHITRDMCFLGGEHISLGKINVFPGQGNTNHQGYVSQVGEHISLGISVSLVRKHLSLGQFSNVFQAIQARKMCFMIFLNKKTNFQATRTRGSKSLKTDILPNGLVHGFGPKLVDYEQSPIFPQGQKSERNASVREKHPTRQKGTRSGEREK